MLDLTRNDPSKIADVGYEFNVILPDGTETDAKITVRGANSPAVKAFSRKVQAELKVREQAAKRKGKEDDMNMDEAEEMLSRAAAVRVISWKGIAEEGKEIAFSKDEAERVLLKYPFIREQVLEESNNILNFRHD